MNNQDTYTGPSFSLTNRVLRVIWTLIYHSFFVYSPKPFFKWRCFLLRCFGAEIGQNVHIYNRVVIWAPWNLKLDDECGVANGVNLYSQGKITIGKRAVISQGSYICTGTHDYNLAGHPLLTYPIIIGDYAWVAAEAFVHPGVNIGEGCVIGARAVVTKDMPAWMVCAGHPCKPIKSRSIVN